MAPIINDMNKEAAMIVLGAGVKTPVLFVNEVDTLVT